MRPLVLAAAGLGALLYGTPVARAQALPTATLVYRRGPGAAGCPDEAVIRGAVASHLGYDPFVDGAAVSIGVTIARTGGVLRASVQRVAPGEAASAARVLTSSQPDCAQLAAAVALTVGIAVDPLALGQAHAADAGSATRPGDAPADAPEVPAVPVVPRVVPVAPARVAAPAAPVARRGPTARRAFVLRAALGAVGAYGAAPEMSAGVRVAVGLRWPAVSLSLEARALFAPSVRFDDGAGYGASSVVAGLAPCVHFGYGVGCVTAVAGALRGTASAGDATASIATPYVAAGVRLGVEVPLGSLPAALAADAGLEVPLTRTSVVVDDRTRWTTSDLVVTLGIHGVAIIR